MEQKGDINMKKIIAILLCISALFALGACGRLTEAKSESVKPEVYFTEDKRGTYTDSVGNVYNYSYRSPRFPAEARTRSG